MYTITEITQQGSMVRIKTNPPGGATITGKLVGHNRSGYVILFSSRYNVYEAPARRIASISSAEWPTKKWDYSNYF